MLSWAQTVTVDSGIPDLGFAAQTGGGGGLTKPGGKAGQGAGAAEGGGEGATEGTGAAEGSADGAGQGAVNGTEAQAAERSGEAAGSAQHVKTVVHAEACAEAHAEARADTHVMAGTDASSRPVEGAGHDLLELYCGNGEREGIICLCSVSLCNNRAADDVGDCV